jgi:hypothetical protein
MFIINLPWHTVTNLEKTVLKKGFNFYVAIPHSNLDMSHAVEAAVSKLLPVNSMEFSWRIKSMLNNTNPLMPNTTGAKSKAPIITGNQQGYKNSSGKVNCTAVLDYSTYTKSYPCYLILGFMNTYPRILLSKLTEMHKN